MGKVWELRDLKPVPLQKAAQIGNFAKVDLAFVQTQFRPPHPTVAGELLHIQHDFHAFSYCNVRAEIASARFKPIDRCAVSNANTRAHSLLSVMHVACHSSAVVSQWYSAVPCLADKLFRVEQGLIDSMSGLWD